MVDTVLLVKAVYLSNHTQVGGVRLWGRRPLVVNRLGVLGFTFVFHIGVRRVDLVLSLLNRVH